MVDAFYNIQPCSSLEKHCCTSVELGRAMTDAIYVWVVKLSFLNSPLFFICILPWCCTITFRLELV